jgi:hypothetical protein
MHHRDTEDAESTEKTLFVEIPPQQTISVASAFSVSLW